MPENKIDFKKTLPCYKAGNKPAFIDVPAMNFIQIDGKGDPNTSKAYEDAITALYPVAYALKFMVKRGPLAVDYGVAPLEGLWWADDMNDFLEGRKQNWKWTMMIMQPEMVTEEMYEEAKAAALKKNKQSAIEQLRFARFDEGRCAQVMYTGPYSGEHDTIMALHKFIKDNSCGLGGHHHEIYMNDMRRTAPEKLKTIIRQPVKVL